MVRHETRPEKCPECTDGLVGPDHAPGRCRTCIGTGFITAEHLELIVERRREWLEEARDERRGTEFQ